MSVYWPWFVCNGFIMGDKLEVFVAHTTVGGCYLLHYWTSTTSNNNN